MFLSLEELKPRRNSTPRDEQAEDQFESFNSGVKVGEPVIEMEVSPDTSVGEIEKKLARVCIWFGLKALFLAFPLPRIVFFISNAITNS